MGVDSTFSRSTTHNESFIIQLKRYIFSLILCFLFLLPTESYSQLFESNDPDIETSGDAFLVLLPTSAVATTLILKDKQGTWQFTKGFLLNLGVTGAMKVLINKERPFQGGDWAFPSGHTCVAFQSASFYHRRYGLI